MTLSRKIVIGLSAGIACGLFFGEICGGLSIIGVPLTVGFVSKWYLVLAIIEQGWWPLALMVLAGSLLALIYLWRIIETAYFQPATEPAGFD